ncbi:MAG: SUF system NifU family Fe-S cluster assembly protein [candidate division Zixibacteria bacterium]|nr:SUF system NifU family Fe-S cluster assembly protein [candidate division Zixibacteria bacterium]
MPMTADYNREDVELDALYRDTVLDHYRSPRGRKTLDRVDLSRDGHNPLCGDRLTLSLKLSGDKIADVAVKGNGCAISIASASMLAEMLPGMTRGDAQRLAEIFRQMMHGHPAPAGVDVGDLDSLEGVRQFPVRIKCALLAWMTLVDVLRQADSGTAETSITVTENDGEVV